jgi:LPXTG-site transpeptidase (sortase) family protein
VETNLGGYTSTYDKDGVTNNTLDQIAVTLVASTNNTGNDFLDANVGSITGQVREDANGNGNPADPDTGINAVTVQLFANDGTGKPTGPVLATTTTNGTGNYTFPSVAPGNYVVVETNPGGYTSTYDKDGVTNNTLDQIAVTIVGSGSSSGNDFLDSRPADITGQVRYDVNNNGNPADADTGINAVTVQLFADDGTGKPTGPVLATTTTNGTGNYTFASQMPGNYVVVETNPAGYTSTYDKDGVTNNTLDQVAVTLVSGTNNTGNDFLDTNVADITGQVRNDTNNNGNPADADSGINAVTVQLFANDGTGKPTGPVLATTITNGTGNYTFANQVPGSYVVVETNLAGYTSTYDKDGVTNNTLDQIAVTLVASTNNTGNDFLDTNVGTVTGQVREDVNGNGNPADPDTGINAVTVQLYADDGTGKPTGPVLGTTTTNGTGNYTFTNVVPGNYVVVETNPGGYTSTYDKDGVTNNTLDQIAVTVTGSATTSGNDFLDSRPADITGQVRYDVNNNGNPADADSGINAVTVQLFANDGTGKPTGPVLATTTTNGTGNYTFAGQMPGSYVVVETNPAGYVSTYDKDGTTNNTLDQIAVTLVSGTNNTANDFLDTNVADITGQVRNDTNNNGNPADPDTGINAVTVQLFADDGTGKPTGPVLGTTTTNGTGNYTFANQVPGSYVVVETNLGGYTSTYDKDGVTNNTLDQIAVTLVASTNNTGNDFLDTQDLPALGIVKSTNGQDANTVPGPAITVGGVVNWTYLVTNTGNVALTNVTVADDQGVTVTCPQTTLAVGASMTCTATGTAVAGQYTNTGTASTTYGGNPVTASDISHYFGTSAAIGLTKTPATQVVVSGTNVSFTLTVTNPGNVPLSTIIITDATCNTLTGPVGDDGDNILQTTETWIYTCTVNNVTAGFTNNAGVTGTPPTGPDVTANASATVSIINPGINIAKTPAMQTVVSGSNATFTLTVTNTGNVALSNVVVTDVLCSTLSAKSGDTNTNNILETTETWTYTCVVNNVTANFTNNAGVSGTPPVGPNVTSNASADVTVIPSSGLTKTLVADSLATTINPQATIGEIVTYAVTINVPANASMANALLTDTLGHGLAFVDCESITPSSGSITTTQDGFGAVCNFPAVANIGADPSDAGRTVSFNFGTLANSLGTDGTVVVRYRVVILDITSVVGGSNLTNDARLTWDGGSLTASDPTLTVVEPRLNIVKAANITTATPGTIITFTLTVSYVGTGSPAYDVYLADKIPTGLTYVPGSFILVSGQAPVLTATAPNLRADWTVFNNTGAPTILQYQATLGNLPGGQSLSNTVNVAWSSLPGPFTVPQSSYNVNSVERDYDPGSAVNIYGANSTASITVAGGVTSSLPATGFAPDRVTVLPEQPAASAYGSLGTLWLEVPKLGIQISIVGVPLKNNQWDLTWLGDQAGYLQGTAFPTWNGNSAITAHVYTADGKPGPFVSLSKLGWGDEVIIHAFGQRYIYQVRDIQRVKPDNMSVFRHEDLPWVTLITCQGYNQKTGDYQYRVAVHAVLLRVEPDNNAGNSAIR